MSTPRPPTGLPEGGTSAWLGPVQSPGLPLPTWAAAVKANLPCSRLKEISKTPQEQVRGGKLKTLAFMLV